jgi:hypothetical protein
MPQYRDKSALRAVLAAGLAVTLLGLAAYPAAAAPPTAGPQSPTPLEAALLANADLPSPYTRLAPPSDTWIEIPPTDFFDQCGESDVPDPPAGDPAQTHLAEVVYRESPGSKALLYEMLAVVGDRNARAAVADTASAWRVCPTTDMITADGDLVHLELSPMAVPSLGDAAAGMRWATRPPAGGHVLQHGKAIMVAVHDVVVEVALSGSAKPDRKLATIAATAVAKLERAR